MEPWKVATIATALIASGFVLVYFLPILAWHVYENWSVPSWVWTAFSIVGVLGAVWLLFFGLSSYFGPGNM